MPGPIQSIERAAAILRLLSGRSRRLGVAELAGELGLPKGTVHGILRTLQLVGKVPKGSVISYTPSGSAPAGSTITLTISSGPKQVVVRDVTGMTVEDATAALEAQGFSVQTTRLLPFVDNVGRQSPGGGSSVDYGSTITLYIF